MISQCVGCEPRNSNSEQGLLGKHFGKTLRRRRRQKKEEKEKERKEGEKGKGEKRGRQKSPLQPRKPQLDVSGH